ncbi:MAG: DUF1849 family protein [Alphaproteobacteria bacterium]|nr:DUF1849 family protein [Alphaproteobacteria bacterium]
MLNARLVSLAAAAASLSMPALAQDFVPHRAAYSVNTLERGRTGGNAGSYAYELRLTCDGYIINQRLRLEVSGGREVVVSEQQSQMSESRDGRRLKFEHRNTANGRASGTVKGEALLEDDGRGQSRFTDPEGRSVPLPTGTLFPVAISRATIQHAKAGDSGFDALFFFGDKVKAPQAVNVLIGKVPKRLVDLAIPEGAEALVSGRDRIYFRGGFFDADPGNKGDQATFEMSSLTLDNGIELYGTHEETDGGIEYRITRLEALPRPTCN